MRQVAFLFLVSSFPVFADDSNDEQLSKREIFSLDAGVSGQFNAKLIKNFFKDYNPRIPPRIGEQTNVSMGFPFITLVDIVSCPYFAVNHFSNQAGKLRSMC